MRLVPVLLTLALCAAGGGGVAALAACGEEDPALPASCREGSDAVAAALARAPGRVALADGTRLSTCVERSTSDADLQSTGVVFTEVAVGLGQQLERGSDAAALQLGYLLGATRRGAERTEGIHLELARRIEQVAGVGGPPPKLRAAFDRGLRAGEREP